MRGNFWVLLLLQVSHFCFLITSSRNPRVYEAGFVFACISKIIPLVEPPPEYIVWVIAHGPSDEYIAEHQRSARRGCSALKLNYPSEAVVISCIKIAAKVPDHDPCITDRDIANV